jgi:hypothetical protein
VQFPPASTFLSNESTWIHFVADHFSPSITGHPAWRLLMSGTAVGCRLKKKSAPPLRGFTECADKKTKKKNTLTECKCNSRNTIYKTIVIYVVAHQQFRFLHIQIRLRD